MKKIILLSLISLLTSPVFGQLSADLKSLITKRFIDSIGREVVVINVPGKPPDTFRMAEVDNFSPTSKILSEVPGYDWSFGCSPTAAAMMAGYYDRTGFNNMYSGPTNNGFAPMDNSSWGTVVISGEIRSQCPLSATRMGVDGRTTRGHVDDYWIVYGNSGPDPYIVNGWAQHAYEDCTGDFMKTSQSVYGLTDGATAFQYYTDGSPRSSTQDGIYGVKLFFQSRGYVVTNYYNQLIHGYNGNSVGFTFAQYRQEIDACRPVLIHVTNHSMLGFGYDSVGNKIYLHDTWDYSTHEMTWGGTYSGLQHYGVSVISLQPVPHIVITTPNGGELWQRGATDTITWNDNIAENVRIELYKEGILYDTIAVSAPSSGVYSWTIPSDLPMSANYKVKITSTGSDSLHDFSNNSFSIAEIPVIITSPVTGLTHTSGISGGTIEVDSSVSITARGVCWSAEPGPTLLNNHNTNGNGTGEFVSNITGMTSSTLYYIRAYATTNFGTTYANQVSCSTLVAPTCGLITVNHVLSGGIAPVDKTVIYETVAKMSGEPLKCWITKNLGADHQATAVNDATEASAGWYWQFNRKQGYKHDGITRTPNTFWNAAINENSNWEVTNDPCILEIGNGWRLPTSSEWSNVDIMGNWTNWNGPWQSDFKIHAAGHLYYADGSIGCRGKNGYYWSSSQSGQVSGWYLLSWSEGSLVFSYSKSYGFTVRCIKEALIPTIYTTIISNITPNTSTSGGQVTNDGGDPVTVRGVCWDTTINPTIAGSHTSDSSGAGVFTSHLTGLTPNTLYFVRAYATNGVGTAYGELVSFYSGFPCGSIITINHVAGSVAPVTKTAVYGTVSNVPGEPAKCWIASNLGADHQSMAVSDTTEESAGWYWQFNRKQGYKHSGSILTPTWTISAISEGSDWIANNDPCAIDLGYGWRIPTSAEWSNVDAAGGWSTWTQSWNSALKLHAAGKLDFNAGALANRGIYGNYRSSKQYDATSAWSLGFSVGACVMEHENSKASGFSIRCLRDTGSFISTATVVTTPGYEIGGSTAFSGGNVTNEGGDTVTVRGVCWSTSPNPTTIDNHTANGNGQGVFTSNLTDLIPHTLYYVRAYATNTIGTAYGNEVSFYTTCGTVAVNHQTGGGVAPVNKTVNYNTITNIPGEPAKCWITSNLGADHQATSVTDATEASAGWYWQFNRKQGYKHDGTTRTPNTAWITSINENLNWQTANDPCAIELGCGWRLPTHSEWVNVDGAGNWIDWNGPWNSALKLHLSGQLYYSDGALKYRGLNGYYWAGTQSGITGGNIFLFYSSGSSATSSSKPFGYSVRCLRESDISATIPIVSTTTVSGYAADFGTSGGNVTSEGGLGVITRGICWSTNSNPTIAGDHTANGGGAGGFVSYLTGLTPNTLYYIRAYATNCLGTAYGDEVSFTSADSYCSSFAISHVAGLVAPVSKSVNYGAVTNIPGESSKCWITSNLGADHQATSVTDATEASAGWYWQFNRKQGYKHDGTTRTPNTTWITSISENTNWEALNDPCVLEIGNFWRLPTYSEWLNVDASGTWTNWNGPWISGLKLHTNGFLSNSSGLVSYRGVQGNYWSLTNGSPTSGRNLIFGGGYSELANSIKTAGFSVRCINDGLIPNNQIILNQVLPNGQTHCYNATQTITVAGNGSTFIIQDGGSATMIAGQNILYNPGTSVLNGGYMHGYIAPGGPWCMAPAMPAVIEGTPDVDLPGAETFRVYPNPTSARFALELAKDPAGNPVRVEIFNLLGKALFKEEFTTGRLRQYSLGDEQPGIYMVRVTQGGVIGSIKVIRQ